MQSRRLMGDGYEPIVERIGKSLTYSLPVDSGFVSFSFTFDIYQNDLDILLSDDYRRSVLEIIAHTLLQRSTIKGNDHFTQENFDNLVLDTLHSKHDHLRVFIERISRENNIVIKHYVKEAVSRRTRC